MDPINISERHTSLLTCVAQFGQKFHFSFNSYLQTRHCGPWAELEGKKFPVPGCDDKACMISAFNDGLAGVDAPVVALALLSVMF